MDINWLQLLRFVHVVAAALWAGAAIFGFSVLMPAVKAAGPAGKTFMETVERRGGFGRYMMPIAILTILSGAVLYWERGFHEAPFATISASMVTLGGIAGTLVLVIGFAYSMPRQRQMKALTGTIGSEGPTPDQQETMAKIGAGLAKAGLAATILLALALVLMAGRFVVT